MGDQQAKKSALRWMFLLLKHRLQRAHKSYLISSNLILKYSYERMIILFRLTLVLLLSMYLY